MFHTDNPGDRIHGLASMSTPSDGSTWTAQAGVHHFHFCARYRFSLLWNQFCAHEYVFNVVEPSFVPTDRFSLLWSPCIEALAAALEHCSQHSWPLLLAQLTTAQASFLAGSSSSATAGHGGGRGPSEPDPAELPQLFDELRRAMCSGDADQNGGCTDAAVRLANILKVGQQIPGTHF